MYRAIIADDEPFVREGLKEMIPWEEIGYSLEGVFKNGKEAVEAVEEICPDIVILDIQMPIMGGLEAAENIRERWPDIAIILLTAYEDFQYAQQAIVLKVKRYVIKSNLLEDLPKALVEVAGELEIEKSGEKNPQERFRVLMEESEYLDMTLENSAKISEIDDCLENLMQAARYDMEETQTADDLIDAINKFIDNNLMKKLNLDLIAEAVHANRCYISRIYKERTGENLFDTINHKKIKIAKKYIEDGNLKIYEIAGMTGWEDTAYFSRVFKKYTGYSPKEYERLYRR